MTDAHETLREAVVEAIGNAPYPPRLHVMGEAHKRDMADAAIATIFDRLREPSDAGIFDRIVTHEQALQSAKNFIDAHFNNAGGKGVFTGIPARPDHDDLILTDYIRQQMARDKLLTASRRRTTSD